uniref:Uncharacterized protein n=1 Tax=Hucho hucho TaxID=62062 RepID=A0A4W5LKN7_9TELE
MYKISRGSNTFFPHWYLCYFPDAVRNIELSPLSFQVSRNNSLVVHVDGSPPMWVCWRFLQNCVSATPTGCHLSMLYENTMILNHTFTALGVHCLDISARNDISKLQTSYSIFVRRDRKSVVIMWSVEIWSTLVTLRRSYSTVHTLSSHFFVKAQRIVKDSSHPSHTVDFSLCYHTASDTGAPSLGPKGSFYTQAIRLLNN